MRVVIAAGGTGGHIFPALALARTLVRDHGAEVRFIGSRDGPEATRVPEAGYRFDGIRTAPFVREISIRAATAPVVAIRSIFACVPLPFLSFGGSALIVTLGAVGVLTSIARAGGLRPTRTSTRKARA